MHYGKDDMCVKVIIILMTRLSTVVFTSQSTDRTLECSVNKRSIVAGGVLN